jgi:ElaA protein
MNIRVLAFDELDTRTAYDVWRLRQDVFVVEQSCPYPDLDGRDLEPGTRHVLLYENNLVGCARVLDEGGEWRIGRIVLVPGARGRGLADRLLEAALTACPDRSVVMDAQTPLRAWYERFGFEVAGPEFLDDGIPHLPMRLTRGG